MSELKEEYLKISEKGNYICIKPYINPSGSQILYKLMCYWKKFIQLLLKQYDKEKETDTEPRFYFTPDKQQYLYIQPTLVAPNPHVFLACESDRRNTTINNIKEFIKNHVLVADGENASGGDSTTAAAAAPAAISAARQRLVSFNETLRADIATIRNMTATLPYMRRYKCLVFDFQFILDASGHLSHVDLDRCYNLKTSLPRIPSLNSVNQCFHNIKYILKQVLT